MLTRAVNADNNRMPSVFGNAFRRVVQDVARSHLVDGQRPLPTEPSHFAAIENAKKLALRLEGQIAHLIEPQGATVCLLEEPGLSLAVVGEGAPLDAEELRFDRRR